MPLRPLTIVSKIANLDLMTTSSPIGSSSVVSSRRRSQRSGEYQAEVARLQPFEDIARAVIRLRMDAGLSQEALAKRMGTTKSAISRLESGHHAPSMNTLNNVAQALGRTLRISFSSPGDNESEETSLPA
jgi:ribosome-binding protein aMBF1 (putative translation factor)